MNTKTIVLAVIVVVLVVLGIWYWGVSKAPATPKAPADTSAMISNDVNSIDLGNLSNDFKNIDADLNTL